MEPLLEKVKQLYGFTIHDREIYRQGTWLMTEAGPYLLQSAPRSYRRKKKLVQDIYHVFKQNHFFHVARIRPTLKGQDGFLYDNHLYYITESFFHCRPPKWNDSSQIAFHLSEFHHATSQFPVKWLYRPFRQIARWPELWNRSLDQLAQNRDFLADDIGEEDPEAMFFILHYTFLNQLGETAIRYLQDADYFNVCEEAAMKGMITYRRLNQDHFLLGYDGDLMFVRPFDWVIDIRARDIAQYIKSQVYELGWQPMGVQQFVANYQQFAPLSREEWMMVYSMLMMPGKFIKRIDWKCRSRRGEETGTEFIPEITDHVTEELHLHEKMLRYFPDLLEEATGIDIPRVSWL